MKYGLKFLLCLVFTLCTVSRAQTVLENTMEEPAVVTVQKDLNQPPEEPAPEQNNIPAAPEKFLAKKDKSIYISTNRASSQSTSAVTEYDFTDSPLKYFGGSSAAKEIETGVWVMIAGDADGNGAVTSADKNLSWRPNNGLTGYRDSDLNLDGAVTAVDKNLFWRPNNGLCTLVP